MGSCSIARSEVPRRRPAGQPALGIKQRLQLAVAVLHDPSLLILDEPTSASTRSRATLLATLIDLSRHQAVTIFITTHFMSEAARCDRISLMHAGPACSRLARPTISSRSAAALR